MKVRILYGTAYFPTFNDAVQHYRPYLGNPVLIGGDERNGRTIRTIAKDRECANMVRKKVIAGEIHIGKKPPIAKGQVLLVREGRYHVAERV